MWGFKSMKTSSSSISHLKEAHQNDSRAVRCCCCCFLSAFTELLLLCFCFCSLSWKNKMSSYTSTASLWYDWLTISNRLESISPVGSYLLWIFTIKSPIVSQLFPLAICNRTFLSVCWQFTHFDRHIQVFAFQWPITAVLFSFTWTEENQKLQIHMCRQNPFLSTFKCDPPCSVRSTMVYFCLQNVFLCSLPTPLQWKQRNFVTCWQQSPPLHASSDFCFTITTSVRLAKVVQFLNAEFAHM